MVNNEDSINPELKIFMSMAGIDLKLLNNQKQKERIVDFYHKHRQDINRMSKIEPLGPTEGPTRRPQMSTRMPSPIPENRTKQQHYQPPPPPPIATKPSFTVKQGPPPPPPPPSGTVGGAPPPPPPPPPPGPGLGAPPPPPGPGAPLPPPPFGGNNSAPKPTSNGSGGGSRGDLMAQIRSQGGVGALKKVDANEGRPKPASKGDFLADIRNKGQSVLKPVDESKPRPGQVMAKDEDDDDPIAIMKKKLNDMNAGLTYSSSEDDSSDSDEWGDQEDEFDC